MTIVEAARGVTGGVDTHLDVHVAAALDPLGGLLGTERFETNAAGYKALLGWLGTFGDVTKVGVEGTGSYGSCSLLFSSSVPMGRRLWRSQKDGAPDGKQPQNPCAERAGYATGRCLSSSHSTFLVASASSMRSGLCGTPAMPRHRSIRGFPPRPVGNCSRPCDPRGSSARTAHSVRFPTASLSRTVMRSSWRRRARRVSRRASSSPMQPSPRPPARPRPASASIPPVTRGWPACRSRTSVGSPS